MRVRLPHQLDRDEVRRRLKARNHEIAEYFPEGMASIGTSWRDDDHMDFIVSIVGQRIGGSVDIEDDHVVIKVSLPMLLRFLETTIESSVRKEGTRLLK